MKKSVKLACALLSLAMLTACGIGLKSVDQADGDQNGVIEVSEDSRQPESTPVSGEGYSASSEVSS